jgi:hypothetical protein
MKVYIVSIMSHYDDYKRATHTNVRVYTDPEKALSMLITNNSMRSKKNSVTEMNPRPTCEPTREIQMILGRYLMAS